MNGALYERRLAPRQVDGWETLCAWLWVVSAHRSKAQAVGKRVGNGGGQLGGFPMLQGGGVYDGLVRFGFRCRADFYRAQIFGRLTVVFCPVLVPMP